MASSTGTHDRDVLDFLAEYSVDRELGQTHPLMHYLRRFPGREEAVAREYFLLQERQLADTAADPRRLGGYELLAELGRGAQGVVWLARDPRLGRDVALKVLQQQRGIGSPQRFQREALVAARLDHPGLATVLDAGQDGDSLWLAMRYVPGQSLGALLAEARGRGADRCLRLPQLGADAGEKDAVLAVVRMVAAASQALEVAHQQGVVHRDVKPGNLLITPHGEPVVVDFGLARDHDSSALCLTHTGDQLGTPAYMAPEQLQPGGAVASPAIDLWGLAVLLYEGVTLVHPFAGPSQQAMTAAIRESEPVPARRLNPAVPRGLGTVLEVALDKDPRRRYRSAAAFAEDLERVANGELPLCRPPGALQKTLRWSRRHPAACAVLLMLALSVGAAFFLQERARQREAELRAQATARADDLKRLARSLLFELHTAVRDLPGATEANQQLGSRALEYLQLLRQDAGLDPQLCADVVQAQLQVGDVLGNPRHPNLGRGEEARRYYEDALALLAGGEVPEAERLRGECQLRLGELDERDHDLGGALRRWRAALATLPAAPEDRALRSLAATLHLRIGESCSWTKEAGDIDPLLELRMALELVHGHDDLAKLAEAEVRTTMARWLLVVGKLDAARAEAEAVEALLQQLPAERSLHLGVRCLRGAVDAELGVVEWKSGNAVDAQRRLERAGAQFAELAALDPQNEQVVRLWLQALSDLSFLHLDQERIAEGKRVLEDVIAVIDKHGVRFGSDWLMERRAECQTRLGQLAYQALDYEAAVRLLGDAVSTQQARSTARPDDLQAQGALARAQLRLGWALVRGGRTGDGRKVLEQASASLRALVEQDGSVLSWQNGLVTAEQQMGEVCFSQGDFIGAARRYQDAVQAQRQIAVSPDGQRSLAVLLQGLAESHTQLRQFGAAVEHAREAVATLRELSAQAPQDRYVARLLATARVGLGRHLQLGGEREAALAQEQEALASVARLDGAADTETPRLLLTKAMAESMLALLHLEGDDRDAAAASARAARATLQRLPANQRRMQEQYASVLAAVERRLGLAETGR